MLRGCQQTPMGRVRRLPVLPTLSAFQLPRRRGGLPLCFLCPSTLFRNQPRLLGYKPCRRFRRHPFMPCFFALVSASQSFGTQKVHGGGQG